ncbi:MAG: outer membrane protein transport protein [Deltaproteobacteria bacterium]|nr:outer membrane protein transport protein [Deltaproteobacteria bacterium]
MRTRHSRPSVISRHRAILLALASTAVTATTTTFICPRESNAGGFYIGDIGARGMGRAGAFVAAPDSLLAIHYNPAALSYLRGFHFESSLTLNYWNTKIERTCPCVSSEQPDAAAIDQRLEAEFRNSPAQSGQALPVPFFALGYGFEPYDLTVSFAAWGPNSGEHDYGIDPSSALGGSSSDAFEALSRRAPHRYSALLSKTSEVNFGIGFGLQPIERFRIGGVIMLFQNSSEQHLHLWANLATLAGTAESPVFDAPLVFSFHRKVAIDWSLGCSYEILDGLTIGTSFRGKRSIRSQGTIDISLTPVAETLGVEVTGREAEVELNTAPILRAGIEYRQPQLFRVEAAVVVEGWSVYDRIVIRPRNVRFNFGEESGVIPEVVENVGWKDAYSFRLGGELNMFEPWVGLRGGYFFETSAVPPERLSPQRVDMNKHGFTLGAASTWSGVTLEASVMYVLLATQRVRNSEIGMIRPLEPPLGSDTLVTTIGNGIYSGNNFSAALSLAFALDG